MNTTPEPTPLMSRTLRQHHQQTPTSHHLRTYDSELTLVRQPYLYGSTASLASTSSSSQNAYTKRRKGRAPQPPPLTTQSAAQESPVTTLNCSPSPSARPSPMATRKKRPAPPPPLVATVCSTPRPATTTTDETLYMTACDITTIGDQSSVADISDISGIIDNTTTFDEKTFVTEETPSSFDNEAEASIAATSVRRIIPLDDSLLNENATNLATTANVVYRRTIVAPTASDLESSSAAQSATDEMSSFTTGGSDEPSPQHHARQWQKVKENKESQNKNRQSQVSLATSTTSHCSASSPDSDPSLSSSAAASFNNNKSTFGKWKRRKGPAPALPPIPPREKMLQMVPLQEIRHELEVIEVQQQGLEKQVN